jgi:transcriptional regulator with XRE-family HTH domain
MPRRPLSSLGAMVREKRGDRTLREIAGEIGIGPATLMRVENGRVPDLATFGKICNWLGEDPRTFLGFKQPEPSHERKQTDQTASTVQISAHLRADQTPQPDTVHALAKMILLALNNQPKIETIPRDDES